MHISSGLGSILLLLAPFCHGQAAAPPGPLQTTAGTGFTGAPYSGKETTVTVRNLSDGTQTTTVVEMQLWRDTQGRTRHEVIRHNASGGEFHSIIITDPVAGMYRKWETGDTGLKPAVVVFPVEAGLHRTAPAAQPNAPTAPRLDTATSGAADQTILIAQSPVVEPSPANTGVQQEKLPPQFINGLWAEGSRTVGYLPLGSEKNSPLVQVVNELWISPELKIILRHVTDDPRTGRTTTEVTDVQFGDPDPALFDPPPNYPLSRAAGGSGPER